MIGFVEYLISKGYKPYRKVMSKKGSTYVEDSNIGFYSSMSEHIDLRLIKGKKEVVYGLHERGHSPTLIYPRPKWVKSDADMDRLFLNYSFEEIYGSLNVNSSRVYRRQKEGREFESHQVHRLLNLN